MTAINLDRRFSNWGERNFGDPEVYQFGYQLWDKIDWDMLLERRLVVVLAEAGSGKSTEFLDQDAVITARGEFSFLVTVRDVAERGFETAIGKRKCEKLQQWLESDRKAWFFLDSVDEAKARGKLLETALQSLADAIAGGERRARIILSGRYSDWEYRRDLDVLNRTLPHPTAMDEEEKVDPNVLVINAIRMEQAKETAEPETPTIVVMQPLDRQRVEIFARAKGIADFEAFFDAMTRSNLLAFARRPLDLQWIAEYWTANRQFGTLREMLTLSLDERLREPNTDRQRVDDLSVEEARQALSRIGAALVLGRLEAVVVPDQGSDLSAESGALDLADILPDWPGAKRSSLITRPVFDPANAGFVRLHNDNQGAVRAFLAARWLHGLRQSNCPAKSIHELVFGESYGVKLVKPTMRETTAWLSIFDGDIAREAIARDPWLLMVSGDPGSLSLETRKHVLLAVIDAVAGDDTVSVHGHDALRRFSKPDLAPFIREQWDLRKSEQAPRELLLQLIWLGNLTACSDLAAEASFGAYEDSYTQMFSGKAFTTTASSQERRRYAQYLLSNSRTISIDVFWDGVNCMFPVEFTIDDLVSAIREPALRNYDTGHGLYYNGKELAAIVRSRLDAANLLNELLTIVADELEEDYRHPLLEMLEACACKLLELAPEAEPPMLVVDAALIVAKADRHHPNATFDRGAGLFAALRSTPARRRAVFWRAVDTISMMQGDLPIRIGSVFQIEYMAFRLHLSASDFDWLANDVAERSDDIVLIANAAMEIWRDTGKSESIFKRIEAISGAYPGFKEVVKHWLVPPVVSEQQRALDEENNRLIQEGQENARKVDQSWIEFSEGLRKDPAQLRTYVPPSANGVDAKLYHLWNLLSRLQGNQTRYSNPDLSRLVPLFGNEVVSEFSAALIAQWRLWQPIPRIERAPGTRNIQSMPDILGILGVSIEASLSEDWAEGLTEGEAESAAVFATLELNGLPQWFPELCKRKPAQVEKMLSRDIETEWYLGPLDLRRDNLESLAKADESVCMLIASRIMAKLESVPLDSMNVLDPALQIALKGMPNSERLEKYAIARFGGSKSFAMKACFIGIAFTLNPVAAIVALEAALEALDSNCQTALALEVMPRIFGGDWTAPTAGMDGVPTSTLERLVYMAYRTIRVEDDIKHGAGQVYSPNGRDNAETARGRALKMLVDREEVAAYDAILRLIAAPELPLDKRHLMRLARERAATDAESREWTSADVCGFELDFTSVPKTPKDLQRILLSRIDDLQHDLVNGDFNQGTTVARLLHEKDVQNWFADALRTRQRRSYSIEREPHVAEEKEPDIRARARESDAGAPIEIKVVESWTLAQLEEALTAQLMGRYLRDRNDRWGILLLVHQGPRPRGWADANGCWLNIGQVVDHLKSIARRIASAEQPAPQMEVALVDVSGVPR